ncbi:MAG: glycogen synthase, partial [Sulfurovum sp.]|nr:glycogen synthase [Sulfurovum sp.]
GLAQMIAMHYGEIPIVHRVGGLADTVHHYKDFDAKTVEGYGIVFSELKAVSFLKAIDQAIELYTSKAHYNKIVKHNMSCDFSWQESAKSYQKLYEKITKKRSHG